MWFIGIWVMKGMKECATMCGAKKIRVFRLVEGRREFLFLLSRVDVELRTVE